MFLIFAIISFFLPAHHPLLNEESTNICPCHIESLEIQNTIDLMLAIAQEKTKNLSEPFFVGLAAPQIGIEKSLILVDTAATGTFVERSLPNFAIFINPQIIWASENELKWPERCCSTGPISGIVPRKEKILIRAYDREGNLITQEFDGYVASILQHEIDHLDGIRFPERILNKEDLHWVEEEEISEYQLLWKEWKKHCPFEKWIEMKNGTCH